MTAPIATSSFKKQGIDLPGMLVAAEKQGISPLDAFLGKLDDLTKGKSPVAVANTMGKLAHNQEARMAALSLLQHKNEFLQMRKMFGAVGPETLETDFQTAFRAPVVKLRTGEEAGQELERRAGEGFAPVVGRLVDGLASLTKFLDSMDTKFPGMENGVLAVTGGLLALGAALAAAGFVGPALISGATLLGLTNPLVLGGLAFTGIAAMGSHYETPETRAQADQLAKERASQEGGPNGQTHDGYNADGTPSAEAEPVKIDLTVRSDPGTKVHVNQQPRGGHVRVNPGPAVGQP